MLKLLSKFFVGVALMASMSWASAGFVVTSFCDVGFLPVQGSGGCNLLNTWGDGSGVHSATLTVNHVILDAPGGANYNLNGNFISFNLSDYPTEVPENFDVTSLLQAGGLGDQFFGVNISDFDGFFNDGASFNAQLTVTVPEPGSMVLVGLALVGLGFVRRQRAK